MNYLRARMMVIIWNLFEEDKEDNDCREKVFSCRMFDRLRKDAIVLCMLSKVGNTKKRCHTMSYRTCNEMEK